MKEKSLKKSTFIKGFAFALTYLLMPWTCTLHAKTNIAQTSTTELYALQETRKVTGVVYDEHQEPLIGVSVSVKGTTTGNMTDIDGKFNIDVSSDKVTLVVSYIGYVTQEIKVTDQKDLTIILKSTDNVLEEYVVVGYAVQKKVNVSGTVSSIEFAEQAASRPLTTVSGALSGLSAGVQVNQSSGAPGSDGSSIKVRGVGSINNTSPLIIIDGMPGIMDAVNPQDIESISVLRDAASAAIYGAQGAHGVILITTKKGNKDGRVNVRYTGNFAYNKPTNLLKAVTNYGDYMELMNESLVNIGQKPNFNQSTIDAWRAAEANPNGLNEHGVPNYIAYPNTNWQDALFGTRWTQQHNLSVNGGNDKTSYLLSTGYLKNPGLVENTGIEQYNVRINLQSKVTSWLTVGTQTYASTRNKQMANFDNANNFLRQTTPGLYPMYDGKYGYPEAPEESATANNILSFLNRRSGKDRQSRFNTTLFSKVEFIKGLAWDFNFNHQRRWDDIRSWDVPLVTSKFSDGTITDPGTTPDNLGTSFSNYSNYSYTIEHLLRYNTTINKDHDLGAILGYNEYYYYEQTNSGSKKGLIDSSITTPGSATEMQSIGGGSTDRAMRSFFGRVNYGYKSRYLLEANFRRDGSSRFGPNTKWGNFPAASAAWRISEEDFMSNTKSYLDNLKLRLSWGKLGYTAEIGDYESQATYNSVNNAFGNIQAPGLAVTGIANSSLAWESATTTNIGLDIGTLRNRLTAEIDFFIKNTNDILYRPDIPLTMGSVTAPRMNIAKMRNTGVELSLKWNDRIGELEYYIGGNFTYIKNELTGYKGKYNAGWVIDENGNEVYKSNLGDVSTGGVQRIVEGKLFNEYYLLDRYTGNQTYFNGDGTVNINGGPRDGIIRTEKDMEWLNAMITAGYKFEPNKTVGKDKIWYGDMIFADHNGDGTYGNANDNRFQKVNHIPKYNFGMQLGAAWKGIDFSMNWAGQAGFELYWGSTSGYNTTATRVGLAIPQDIADDHYFYNPENPDDPRTNIDAKYPRLTNGESGSQNTVASSNYLFNGNYLKLKNLTIGYTIPSKFTRKYFVENLRFYFSGENLWTITSFPGQDPEMGSSPKYTSAKQISFGVNATF